MITVVIPAYNRVALLRRALLSLEQQTVIPEVIVVDDASTESLSEAAIGLNLRIKFLRNSERIGAQRSRLLGVEASQTPLVGLLDSDDWWKSSKLEHQLAVISQFPGAIIACRLVAVSGERSKVVPARSYDNREPIEDFLYLSGGVLQTSTFVAQREIMTDLLKATVDTKVHNDTAMMIRARELDLKIIQLEEALSYFDNGDRHDRISLDRSKIDDSLKWFRRVGVNWSAEARSAFMINDSAFRLLKAGRRLEAAKLVMTNLHARTLLLAARMLIFIICNGSPKRWLRWGCS